MNEMRTRPYEQTFAFSVCGLLSIAVLGQLRVVLWRPLYYFWVAFGEYG